MPALAIGALALALQGRVDGPVAAGAIALAIVPAPLLAPEIVGRMRGRADLAGALVLGTIVLSLLVVGSRGALAAGALFAGTEAFAISAMVANGLPAIRDRVLIPLRAIGWLAVLVVLASSAATAPPLVVASAIVALSLFAIGCVASLVTVRAVGGDLRAALGGAGLRDPALGAALATITAGPDATGVPLLYAVFCLGLAAFALRRR